MLKVVCGKAAEITLAYGHRLVGATVFTSVVGKWNGGMATVIEIQPGRRRTRDTAADKTLRIRG